MFLAYSPGLDHDGTAFPGNGIIEPDTWGDEAWIVTDGFVNTEGFLGWLYVEMAPWVYSYALDQWIYIEEANVTATGAWGYISRQ